MEFTTEQRKVLNDALEEYGIRSQSDIAIEEMAELTKAIIKCRRNPSVIATENLYEEIADVLIMLEQLSIHYDSDYIEQIIAKKIDRLKKRIDADREKRYGGMNNNA